MSNYSTFSPKYKNQGGIQIESPLPKSSKIVVAGAGAFGGWSALFLKEAGYDVTLVDPWGGGHSRASSGGETRLIRCIYGDNELYTKMTVRSFELWRKYQQNFPTQVIHDLPTWWFCANEKDELLDASIPLLQKFGLPFEKISADAFHNIEPKIFTDDLHHVLVEQRSGYLKAREATMAVQEFFIQSGGTYIESGLHPRTFEQEKTSQVQLTNGNHLDCDLLLVTTGPWLVDLLPDLKAHLSVTKQEVFYFGTPVDFGNTCCNWVDRSGENFFYGLPQGNKRGFKIALDRRGLPFDPTSGDRTLDPELLEECRNFLSHRFPALNGAPLVEHRTCQYTNTLDGNFIFDKYPGLENCWVLGGGSGHGFKHGPALGEFVSKVIRGQKPNESLFQLARFS